MHSFKTKSDRRARSPRRDAQTRACIGRRLPIIVLVLSVFSSQGAIGQTQQEATEFQLRAPVGTNQYCQELAGPAGSPQRADFFLTAGPQLTNICSIPGGPPGSLSGGVAAGNAVTTAPTEIAVERLLELRGENEDERPASANAELLPGFNVWFTSQFESLDRDVTTFEDGYESDKRGVTAGIDRQFTNRFLGGVALNYKEWDGDFDGGGDFKTDSFGPVLYASFTPMENVFVDVAFGYSKQSGDRSRSTFFEKPGVFVPQLFGGEVAGDIDADEYNARVVIGFDHSVGKFTIGPHLGVDYTRVEIDKFTESGETGLELSYDDDTVKSLKAIVGVLATAAFSMDFGVLSVQVNADWTHESENDQRDIFVQFAQDGRTVPKTFGFQTESPDRDNFHIGGGVVAVLPNGIQTFANLEVLFGHDYLDNYVATIGVRIEL